MTEPEFEAGDPNGYRLKADKIVADKIVATPGVLEEMAKELSEGDVVSHPRHYVSHPSGIEPIEITKHESFLRGNIIKYIMRAPYKGAELRDLEKAQQYLAWEIERVKNG